MSDQPANIPQQVVDAFGGLTEMSKKLGIPVTTIASWRDAGRIPRWRKPAIIEGAAREGISLPADFSPAPAVAA
jgi:hypothetical protein